MPRQHQPHGQLVSQSVTRLKKAVTTLIGLTKDTRGSHCVSFGGNPTRLPNLQGICEIIYILQTFSIFYYAKTRAAVRLLNMLPLGSLVGLVGCRLIYLGSLVVQYPPAGRSLALFIVLFTRSLNWLTKKRYICC